MTEQTQNPNVEPLLSLLAPGRDKLRLALLLRERDSQQAFEALPEPFMKIGETAFSNLYLARIDNTDGLYQQDVVVKIQKDRPLGVGRMGNPIPLQALKLEAHSLSLFAHKEEGPLVRCLFHQRGETTPPLFFCKRVQQYFHPQCPDCGCLLRDCRDESLLQSAGLPSYASSEHRFLACPQCSHNADKVMFYSNSTDRQKHPRVQDRWKLIQAMGKIVAKDVAAKMPCHKCQYRQTCYDGKGGDAGSLLVPLAFHDFHVSIHEWLPLRFDEFTDMLGGKPWQAVLEELQSQFQVDRLAVLQQSRALQPFSGFISIGGHKDRLALEVLYGKLNVFLQLCRSVRQIHHHLKRPVYDLNPDNIWLQSYDNGQVPSYWVMRLRIANLDNAISQQQAAQLTPVIRGQGESSLYIHPALLQSAGNERRPGRLTITQLQGDNTQTRMQAIMDTGLYRQDDSVSRLQLIFGRSQGFQKEFALDAAVVQRQQNRLLLQADLTAVKFSPADLSQMQAVASIPGMEVQYQVVHAFNDTLDFFSLGMLLFRALLVNKEQSIAMVSDHINTLSKQWAAATDKNAFIAACAEQPVMQVRHIWYEPQETFLPLSIWCPLLTLGFELLHAGPEHNMDQVVQMTETITNQLRHALFHEPAGMHQDMYQVLSEVINDPNWIKQLQITSTAAPGAVQAPAKHATVNRPVKRPEKPQKPKPQTSHDVKPQWPTGDETIGPRVEKPVWPSDMPKKENPAWPTASTDETMGPTPVVQPVPQDMMEQTIIMAGRMASATTHDKNAVDDDLSTQMFSALERTIKSTGDDDYDTPPRIDMNTTVDVSSEPQRRGQDAGRKTARPNNPPPQPPPPRHEPDPVWRQDTLDSTVIVGRDKIDDGPQHPPIDDSIDQELPPPPIDFSDLPEVEKTVILQKSPSAGGPAQNGFQDVDQTFDRTRDNGTDNFRGVDQTMDQTFQPSSGFGSDDDDDDDDIDNTIIIRPEKE